jgi:circadian clock protein KaiC
VAKGERVLYVALSETVAEIEEVARSHGWSLEGVAIREVVPNEEILKPEEQYTILHPSEVELGETIAAILEEVEATKPARVAIDSLSELQLLARDPLRYRHHMLALKQYFSGRSCTVLLLDNTGGEESGLASIAHSVIQMEQLVQDFGGTRRRLKVQKVRASRFRGGYQDYVIETGGLVVYPRLVAAEHRAPFQAGLALSGVPELDNLLGGGLNRGTSVLLMGPAGTGKSALATQYALAAAERGERAVLYVFEERVETFLARAEGLGMVLGPHLEAGRIVIRQLAPTELSPGEFIHNVRRAVEEDGARLVVIDSLNGYLNAMAEERLVLVQLHELLSYLGGKGVLTLLTVAQHGMVGSALESPVDASYLADTVIVMRYFETGGRVRQAISVMKKRSGAHEHSVREFRLGPGVQVGEPLYDFQGVLAGVPTYVGGEGTLLSNGER